MIPDKEVKKKFKEVTKNDPDKYYATGVLKKEGFHRKTCKETGTYFWTTDKSREVCGEPAVSGGFTFLEKKIAKKSMSYVDVWKKFSEFFEKRGYKPIERYPVVARWRDDTDFVQASIYDFQPYVVKGEIEPSANPLTVPQFCLRFNDIDNVGITMSHNTGFVMIGQHAFMPENKWDRDKYFKDLLDWFIIGVGIPKDELVLHEDAWAGGGNFGSCMEFFSGGVELGNQVYMLYEQTPKGDRELSLKVLDMGMGQERVAWFSNAKGTMYDSTFPGVIKEIIRRTKIEYDEEFVEKYIPWASFLNVDEVEDIDSAWKKVAKKMGTSVEELRKKILPLSAAYSVAEHSRSLLVAISDGALPSNVKGGYNLRVILRRALGFIKKYDWDLDLGEICEWHAEELKDIFPELKQNILHVKNIISVEKEKYEESMSRSLKVLDRTLKKEMNTEKLIELYDSHGLSPDIVKDIAADKGINVKVPDNFYSLVSEKHEKSEQSTQTKKEMSFDVSKSQGPTQILYFDHYDYVVFTAHVTEIIKNADAQYLILDKSAFYPTSGGQVHDKGTINNFEVEDVIKQGNIILHKVKGDFKKGEKVECKIDFDRRLQLAQHHTATHILTGSSRRILGNHVWQAGAAKTVEKSRLDITHYEQLSEEQVKKIEDYANKIVKENRPVYKSFMKRNLAEAQYGVRIYQGGAVPGKELRIVNIDDFDVEACGGTHLDVTGDIESIKILKTSKIQDGIVRLEFVAGGAAEKEFEKERNIIKKSKELLDCEAEQIPGRAEELFSKWKKAKKGKLEEYLLESKGEYKGDIVQRTSEILKTQPEHIIKTIERFDKEIKNKMELK